jgi:hypothetical protein
MITNLLCSIVVTLVTNTSDRFPTHLVPAPCPDGMLGCLVNHYRDEADLNPTTKWTRTTVKRVTTLEFQFQGKPMAATTEEVLSNVEVTYQLEKVEAWKPKETNDLTVATAPLWITNGILYGTNWAVTNWFGPATFGTNTFNVTNLLR